MKAKEIIKQLEADGWRIVRQKGSHVQLKKEGMMELITIPEHGNKEVSIGVYNKIRKIAGWK
ncbi:MAG TPA: type II toxin-antitoxin system HicA family toxin [Chitinophagales bacterium]|nr:type II toxin-antitoxin system HicA family toxin [Chitinophagales bacterium]